MKIPRPQEGEIKVEAPLNQKNHRTRTTIRLEVQLSQKYNYIRSTIKLEVHELS